MPRRRGCVGALDTRHRSVYTVLVLRTAGSSVKYIPIFTYHSLNAPGNTYASNDHVALECDLITLKALGYRVLPLP